MSEWVSWETCPVCGTRMAVGWDPPYGAAGTATAAAVEFDCYNGCQLPRSWKVIRALAALRCDGLPMVSA
jgi:hypothetical protein